MQFTRRNALLMLGASSLAACKSPGASVKAGLLSGTSTTSDDRFWGKGFEASELQTAAMEAF